MNLRKITNLVLTFGLLSFGAASCDILDPWDPGNGGGGNGGGGNGGGCDTLIVEQPEQIVKGLGTVHLITSAEGYSFWGIEDVDGKKYEPTNLPEQFAQDGLKVNFAALVLSDWPSYNNYGKIVELVEIYNVD